VGVSFTTTKEKEEVKPKSTFNSKNRAKNFPQNF